MRRASFVLVLSLLSACDKDGDGVVPPDIEGNQLDFGFFDEPGNQPTFGQTVSQTSAPPPISGGTLLMLKDGRTAIAADPDRDRVFVVNLDTAISAEVVLQDGDEPGRSVEDGSGHVHVVLRRGAAVLDLDPTTGTILGRRNVCPAPRGIAYQATGDLLHVACAGGELVSLPAAGGDITRSFMLERDLRDVVVVNDQLRVSKFRSAEVLIVNSIGQIADRLTPAQFNGSFSSFAPAIAWRTLALPTGELIMVHQRGNSSGVETTQGGYGGQGPCDGIVQGTVSLLVPGQTPTAGSAVDQAVLPVDVAISPDASTVAMLAAGNSHIPGMPLVFEMAVSDLRRDENGDCMQDQNTINGNITSSGEPVAIAYTAKGSVVVQSREPAQLQIYDTLISVPVTISLSNTSRADTGHAIFHSNSGASVACASCHAEGGEDGRTWTFISNGFSSDEVSAEDGPRRTQSLRGGILGTEPFHWEGDQKNLGMLMQQVFVGRMSGPNVADDQLHALSSWIDSIPLIPNSPPADTAAVARGQALFEDSSIGCTGCHSGAKLTDNISVDVGTGSAFQVPSLRGVGYRSPFMHDGCATTLTDRFGGCGGTNHGNTASLTSNNIADLVSYLQTL